MRCIILISMLISKSIFACSDFHWDWKVDDCISGSKSIYHGMVVSLSLDKKSIYDGETDPLSNAISLRGDKVIKFKVFETLKGKKETVVKAILLECVGGWPEFGDTGLLFRVEKIWHMKPQDGDSGEGVPARILRKLSKVKQKLDLKP